MSEDNSISIEGDKRGEGEEELNCDKCGKDIRAKEKYTSKCLYYEYRDEDDDGYFVNVINSAYDEIYCLKCSRHKREFKEIIGEKTGLDGKKTCSSEDKNLGETKKTKLPELLTIKTPKKSFKDIVLPEETIISLKAALMQAKHEKKFMHEWGMKKMFDYGLGTTLNFHGPPGTGKTLAAEIIAKEAGKKFLKVNYSEMISMWCGRTEKNISEAFRKAKEMNAVLFFDEADSIASNRVAVNNATDAYKNSETNVLLQELENFEGTVIFATNMQLTVDPAFERRLSMHVFFGAPDFESRKKLFKLLVPKKMPVAKNVSFDKICRHGLTGGDIKNIIINAGRFALLENKNEISRQNFEKALNQVLSIKNNGLAEENAVGYVG